MRGERLELLINKTENLSSGVSFISRLFACCNFVFIVGDIPEDKQKSGKVHVLEKREALYYYWFSYCCDCLHNRVDGLRRIGLAGLSCEEITNQQFTLKHLYFRCILFNVYRIDLSLLLMHIKYQFIHELLCSSITFAIIIGVTL